MTQGTCLLQKKMLRQSKIAQRFGMNCLDNKNEKVFEYMKLENAMSYKIFIEVVRKTMG
jgi:hypothetical protein